MQMKAESSRARTTRPRSNPTRIESPPPQRSGKPVPAAIRTSNTSSRTSRADSMPLTTGARTNATKNAPPARAAGPEQVRLNNL